MRTPSDCIGDMLRTRTEDRQVEYLLSRQAGEVGNGLASLLGTLDLQRLNVSIDDRAAEFAATASQLVSQTERTASFRPARPLLVPRLATAALAAVLVVGLTGVAVASDGAAPGDTLYGVDRALERIGINDGGLRERLTEAQTLTDNGQTARALAHLAEAFGPTSSNAADALQAAAERVAPQGKPSQTVLEGVEEMLEWMNNTDASGPDFGQGVAERAHELGAGQGNNPPVTLPDATGDDGNGDHPNKGSGSDSKGGADNSENPGGGNNGQDGGNGNEPPAGSPPGPPDR